MDGGINPVNNFDFGKLSEPATVLINRVADAVGGIFGPGQVVRMAKAKVKAKKIETIGDIEIQGLRERAFYRLLTEATEKQQNIENVTRKAIPLLDQSARPQDIERDWLVG